MSQAAAVLAAIASYAPALPPSFTASEVARLTGAKCPEGIASFRYQGELYIRNETRTVWMRADILPETRPQMIEGQVRFSYAQRERMRALLDDFMAGRVIEVYKLAEALHESLSILYQADAPEGH